MPYDAHVSDRVLFVKCTRMLENKEATEKLCSIKNEMETDKIDGVGFVENQGYEILPAEDEKDDGNKDEEATDRTDGNG